MTKEYVGTKKNGLNNRLTLPNYVVRRLKIKPETRFKIDIEERDGDGRAIVLTPIEAGSKVDESRVR